MEQKKKIIKKERQLKVLTKYQTRPFSEIIAVPEIRLEGKWLRASGFEEGKQVLVTVQKNKLTITLVK